MLGREIGKGGEEGGTKSLESNVTVVTARTTVPTVTSWRISSLCTIKREISMIVS